MSNCIECGNIVKTEDLSDRSSFYIFLDSGRCPNCTDSCFNGLKNLLNDISKPSLN